jgi:hypothetical protein
MSTNPFISQTRNPILENIGGQSECEPASANLSNSDSARTVRKFGSAQHERRFLRRVGFVSLVFLILVFTVFREVKHNRELYRMNQLVVATEAQRRQWQELARLDEAREAGLMAELLRLQSLPRDSQIIQASYTLIERRH